MATSLTQGASVAQDSNSVASSELPAWYQEYTQGIAAQAGGLANNLNNQPLPAQSVAGFNPDQTKAFEMTRANTGSWSPLMQSAADAAMGAPAQVSQFVDYAQDVVADPSQQWTNNYRQYMSPYTTSVVNEIGRLGKRNFEENIMPGVNSTMIGAGQFGSTRNADILSRAARDTTADITGQQAKAMESGYGQAAGIFANDANRYQQQQQMQANTAMSGAAQADRTLSGNAAQLGGLAQTYQGLQGTDANNLLKQGNQQQLLQQTGYDTAYGNAMTARQDPWTQLSNAASVTANMQLPKTTVASQSNPTGYAPSALGALGTAWGILNGLPQSGG